MGRRSSSGTGSVGSLLQVLQIQYFQATTPSFNYMNKSNSYNAQPWHMLCSIPNRALLLAQHHARSRSNLNQRNHTRFFYGAAHERFDQATILPADQSHRDHLYSPTPDRHCCEPSSYDDALSDRMRRRRRGRVAGGAGTTASLAWSPVQDPSVYGYFVHYGRQSPGQPGSCSYESSMYVDSPSATVTNLDPDTLYHFTVSAYNDLESACSNEVSTVTSPPSTPPPSV